MWNNNVSAYSLLTCLFFSTPLHSSPMAEKCQHTDTASGTLCDCPHFVARINLTSVEVNICDGCLHTVAWHRIPIQETISSAGVKLSCKELNKRRWLMVEYISPGWSLGVQILDGSESEGLGFNLCVAPPHIVVSLISKDKGWVGDRRSEMTSS